MAVPSPRMDATTRFAILFFFTAGTRSVLLSVVPLAALAHLGGAERVSLVYLLVSLASIGSSIALPALVLRIRTRATFGLAVLAAALAPALLGHSSVAMFVAGMALYAFATVAFEVSLNLYIMYRIRRQEIGLFEPKRVLCAVAAYCVGPSLGVYLQLEVGHLAPYALSSLLAGAAWLYFRSLGLSEAGAPRSLEGTGNPLRHVRQYFAQPRLRLAWFISFARAGWWSTFFLYAPIYAVTAGLGEMAGGLIVSAGVGMVFTVTLWGRLGRRHGLRRLLMGGFAATGMMSIVVAALPDGGTGVAAVLVLAALCAASIDGAGNVPFLRAVRPSQRARMSGVFGTYRDMSQLAPPAIASVVLRVLPVPAVFGVAGLGMLAMAWFSRHLPRRFA